MLLKFVAQLILQVAPVVSPDGVLAQPPSEGGWRWVTAHGRLVAPVGPQCHSCLSGWRMMTHGFVCSFVGFTGLAAQGGREWHHCWFTDWTCTQKGTSV
jgi:hypothetical protein